MVKKFAFGALAGVTILLAGCGASAIEDVPAMTLEEVAGQRLAQLSTDEKEGLIYQHVTDQIKVDKERLINIDSKDATRINTLLSQANNYLKGSNNDSISSEYANYLLMEFARTPYEWKQSKVDMVGFDPAARLYFVDVTYETTDKFKNVVPSSKIPNGSPDEDFLKDQRYKDYISYLTYRNNGDAARSSQVLGAFVKAWGSVESVMQEQQGVSLVERTRAFNQSSGGLGKLTYNGLVQDSKFTGGAKMTVRYVMKYKFNLGEETDLQISALYLKDYALNDAETISKSYVSDTVGVEVLKPFIDKLILSYHKAVEENNDSGLYSLFFDYSSLDKYYEDLNKYTYNSIGGYNFKILSRSGKNVAVEVKRLNQIRAKGAEMSLPTYNETLIYNLVLDDDDKIKIRSVNLLNSTMAGEPISVIKNVSGVSDMIQYSGESFTASNKDKVEEVLKAFSKVVFDAQVDDSDFTDIVDIGVSQSTLKKISDVVQAVPGSNRKVNYIVSWDTKTNVYVSVTMREIFETTDGNLDTESVVDLVNRNGEWKVVNYTRKLNIKTGTTQVNAKNALSEDVR